MTPSLPDFDVDEWSTKPESERVRAMCGSWAVQGFGAPVGAYAFYVVKLAIWIGLWVLFSGRSAGVGGLGDISQWWSLPVVFEKAIVWTMLFEVLGLGCGSGPLTGRYLPPVVAFTHFLRPGTTRLPAFPRRVPLTAGYRRSMVDCLLYAALIATALRALLSTGDGLDAAHLWPLVVLLPLLGLRDKTIFLAARSEHYWATIVVFLVAGDDLRVLLGGTMCVQLAIWWGAATSKLNHHFPNVVTIMVSNSPFQPGFVRRAMYRNFPDDLRASKLAAGLAHGGTVIEFAFPLVLAVSNGGPPTAVALVVMLAFHLFITASVPMGVPIEWNVLFVYSMFVLFGAYAERNPLDVTGSPLLTALLVIGVFVGPVLGNLRPDKSSFLPGMRYYAGNWAASLWLFRRGSDAKLDEHITKTAPIVANQLARLYGPETIAAVTGKLRAFRSMHLHGRALNALLPRVVEDLEAYEVSEGEGIAGVVLGWNFGDGHLHNDQLLDAVQAQCGFEPGELRCLFLESQPAGKPWMHWRIVDAADGPVEQGRVIVADLLDHQPWPVDPSTIRLHAPARTTMREPVSGPKAPRTPRAVRTGRRATTDGPVRGRAPCRGHR